MSEISALRRLAEALQELEELEAFAFDATGCTGMDLSWSIGRATRGYKQMQTAMSAIVGQIWCQIRFKALCAARDKVNEARRDLEIISKQGVSRE